MKTSDYGPRDKKWFEEHPSAFDAPEPYGTSYRVLSVKELRAMVPYAQGARLAAIEAHLRVRVPRAS